MAAETNIHLYAEHLLNIRALTLTATLSSESTPLTKAKLSADATSITITHEDITASIRLPTAIEGGGDAVLELPQNAAKDLELRLRLEEKDPDNRFIKDTLGNGSFAETSNWTPWAARTLASRSGTLACLSCKTPFLSTRTQANSKEVSQAKPSMNFEWKDLPNENWAEMMDFWHCHKPDNKEDSAADFSNAKGYAAGNRVRSVKGTGLVDVSSCLLSPEDCISIEIVSDSSDLPVLKCRECSVEIGVADSQAEGWRLWKWALIYVDDATPTVFQSSPPEKWISAIFLATIENFGTRKLAVFDTQSGEGVLAWIFTPDLSFSSSQQIDGCHRLDPTRAMKIFWQELAEPAGSYANSSTVEEISIPSRLFKVLRKVLVESKYLVPRKSRTFREWNVALLQRFRGDEQD